jgi:hypothetical protein
MNLKIKPVAEVVEHLQTYLKSALASCSRKSQALESSKKEMVRLASVESLGMSVDKHFEDLQTRLRLTSEALTKDITARTEYMLQSYSSKLVRTT